MPDPVTTTIIGTGVSAGSSAYAAKKGADAVGEASDRAAELAMEQYKQTREDLSPYRDAGSNALSDYSNLTSPKASAEQLKKWRTNRKATNERADRIQARIDRREGNGFTRGSTTTTTGGTATGGPDTSTFAGSAAADLGAGLSGSGLSLGSELDSAFNLDGETTTTTPGDAKLNKLYDRLEKAETRKSNLTDKIKDGKVGVELRDPDDYGSDPLYNDFETESVTLGDDYNAFRGEQLSRKNRYKAKTQNFKGSAFDYKEPTSEDWKNSELYMEKPSWEFETSPGYNFRIDEATDTVTGDAASRGLRFSGDTMKDLNREIQGIASNEYGNWHNQTLNEQNLHNNAYTGFKSDNRADFNTNLAGRKDYLTQRDKDRAWNYGVKRDDIAQADKNRLFNYNVDVDDYNRDFASNAYNQGLARDSWGRAYGQGRDAVNDLARTVDWGLSASGMTANAGANAATNAGNAAMIGGNAAADGYMGMSNALNRGLESGWDAYGDLYGEKKYGSTGTGTNWGL